MHLFNELTILFNNRINISIIILTIFIIILYIINTNNFNIEQYNNDDLNNNIRYKNLQNGEYILKDLNNNTVLNPQNFKSTYLSWKIKNINGRYQFETVDKNDRLYINTNNQIIKILSESECNKKSLCGVDNIINEDENDKHTIFDIYDIQNNSNESILMINNKYVCFNNNEIILSNNFNKNCIIHFQQKEINT
jgi:hypothetical protein